MLSSSVALLVAQRFDRIELRRTPCWIASEHESDGKTCSDRLDDGRPRDRCSDVESRADRQSADHPERNADHRAELTERDRFDDELCEDVSPRRADGLADSDLT